MKVRFVYVVSTAEPDAEILMVVDNKEVAEELAEHHGAYVTETRYMTGFRKVK